jgi:hypothetical protein
LFLVMVTGLERFLKFTDGHMTTVSQVLQMISFLKMFLIPKLLNLTWSMRRTELVPRLVIDVDKKNCIKV